MRSLKNARRGFRDADHGVKLSFMTELEITVAELKKRLDAGERLLLVDVREPWEYEVCRIEGAKLIPMQKISANLQLLDQEEPVICYCHHGMRSLDVVVWLQKQGVESARSLTGGIDKWSAEIDPKVPRY
jgi:rhodanese-related sulfurtransferase